MLVGNLEKASFTCKTIWWIWMQIEWFKGKKNMATVADIGVSAAINLLSALAFLVAFAILRLQPFNDRVYFPKWYLKGIRGSPTSSRSVVGKFVNLDIRTYIKFLNWMPAALRMPEPELIDHAGLDSAVYIRIYVLGWVKNTVSELKEDIFKWHSNIWSTIVFYLKNLSCFPF